MPSGSLLREGFCFRQMVPKMTFIFCARFVKILYIALFFIDNDNDYVGVVEYIKQHTEL